MDLSVPLDSNKSTRALAPKRCRPPALWILTGEISNSTAMFGITSIKQLDRGYLRRETVPRLDEQLCCPDGSAAPAQGQLVAKSIRRVQCEGDLDQFAALQMVRAANLDGHIARLATEV